MYLWAVCFVFTNIKIINRGGVAGSVSVSCGTPIRIQSIALFQHNGIVATAPADWLANWSINESESVTLSDTVNGQTLYLLFDSRVDKSMVMCCPKQTNKQASKLENMRACLFSPFKGLSFSRFRHLCRGLKDNWSHCRVSSRKHFKQQCTLQAVVFINWQYVLCGSRRKTGTTNTEI